MQHWMAGVCVLAVAGCAAEDRTCKFAIATEVPLHLARDGAYIVNMRVGTGEVRLIVDTGASGTLLTRDAVARVGGDATPTTDTVSGVGGTNQTSVTKPVPLHLAGISAQRPVVGADFSPGAAGQRYDGILGEDILSGFEVDFDTLNNRMILVRAGRYCTQPPTVTGAPFTAIRFGGAPHVRAPIIPVSIGGRSFQAVVDSGADHTSLFRPTADAIGLPPLGPDDRATFRGVGNQSVRAGARKVEAIGFGGITVRNVTVAVLDQDAPAGVDLLLGRDLLRQMHVFISNVAHVVMLQYPPRPTTLSSAPAS